MTNARKIIKKLASLQLAVVVIILMAGLSAWGTFVEAHYNDAKAAQNIVYHSKWMYATMLMLAINLSAVMVDRWPWKSRHIPFLLAHVGIQVLILGSIATRYFGIDGSVSLEIGGTESRVMVSNTDLVVYASYDGVKTTKLFEKEVNFFMDTPTEEKPLEIQVPGGPIRIVDYYPYAFREAKVVEGDPLRNGAAVRFQLQNDRVNLSEWIMQSGVGRVEIKDLGPARVVLTTDPFISDEPGNILVLRPIKKEPGFLEYEIHTASSKSVTRGKIQPGDSVETGWMGLKLRLLKFLPSAREEINYVKHGKATDLTLSAIQVEFAGVKHWSSLNSMMNLFTDQAVYMVMYGNRQIPLGFDMKLKKFEVGRYQGTMRAASYQSLVEVPGIPEYLISMNEPLKYGGYTFYQASFQSDEQTGQPVASILSVNWDPGRWIKYLGSLMLVLGILDLFYFRKMRKT